MILVKPSYEVLSVQSGHPEDPLKLIELAGRTCYKSEHKSTEDSAKKFVKMLIDRGHHSVIEHSSITVKFICDRGVTHELVRHRLASYSQESTRYCNYKGGVAFVIPPWIKEICRGEYLVGDPIPKFIQYPSNEFLWFIAMLDAESYYQRMIAGGWSPQQARSVLPNSLKTEIVMTANIREWRHVLTLRTSKEAHPQMREIMTPFLKWMQHNIPILFDDIMAE